MLDVSMMVDDLLDTILAAVATELALHGHMVCNR
jgi:hypothetical protein